MGGFNIKEASITESAEAPPAVTLTANMMNKKNDRLTLGAQFTDCAGIGNPNISRENVVVISVADLKAWGRMPFFEECSEKGQHVLMKELTGGDKIAFISHRWHDATSNQADDAACSQYLVSMIFLGSEEGQSVTHVWLDLACINQDQGNPEGMKQFLAS